MKRTWKRAFALFLSLVMCLSLFPASAFAEGDVAEEPADPVVLSDGEGSQEGEAAGDGDNDNPSVSEADSSPYTGEPMADSVILSDSEGFQETGPADEDAVIDLQPLTGVELDGLDEEPAAEVQDAATSGTCGAQGDNLTWSFDAESGTLTISGSGDMKTFYDEDLPPWYYSASTFLVITIEPGVTSIGQYAFSNCRALRSISLPESLVSISVNAFNECGALTDVYYGGTEAQKNALVGKGWETGGNEYLLNATWHCAGEPAEPTIVASGECGAEGNNLLWTLDDQGTLTISGTGAMADYEMGNYSPWYNSLRDQIKRVVIADGVTSIGSSAFEWCESLESVTIPESVTRIGGHAFYYCLVLSGVALPESLTSIGDWAFAYCRTLTSVTIPESVALIDEGAFRACSGLTSIELPDGVTSIGYGAFEECSSLASITLTASVTSIDRTAFNNCPSLTMFAVAPDNQDFSSADGVLFNKAQTELIRCPGGKSGAYAVPDSVTVIGKCAFEHCSGLTGITIPDGVTHIGEQSFMYCSGLTSISLPASVTSIGSGSFSTCSGLTSIELPDGVTSIVSGTFSGCGALSSITIPASVTSIEDWAFTSCEALSEVYYGGTEAQKNALVGKGWETDGNEHLLNATWHYTGESPEREIFASGECGAEGDNLTWVLYDDGELVIGGSGAMAGFHQAPWDDYSGSIQRVTLESGVTSIGEYAFYRCTNLTTITIPVSVMSIGEYAFDGCSALTEVNYGGNAARKDALTGDRWRTDGNSELFAAQWHLTETADPTIIDSGECGAAGDNLTWALYTSWELVISGEGDMRDCYPEAAPWELWNDNILKVVIADGVTSIGSHAFDQCSQLAEVSLPESLLNIGTMAFDRCQSLTDITLPGGLLSIGEQAFAGCTGLTGMEIPASVTSIAADAFICSSAIASFTVAAENSAYSSIDGVLFNKEQTKLLRFPEGKSADYTIPESVTEIGDYAFYCCSGLSAVTIPANVTDIGELAFAACSTLTDMAIPAGVYHIGRSAFTDCVTLTSIAIPESVTELPEGLCYGCGDLVSVNLPQNLTSIGFNAFGQCGSLTSIALPASVTSIGDYAFNCSSLNEVYYGGTEAQKNALINNGWSAEGNDPFYYAKWHYAGEPAEREILASGACEYNLLWTLYDDGELVISGEGEMNIPGRYEDIAAYSFAPWDNYRSDIRKITIEPGVTSIYRQAFVNCENLTEVSIPDSVTSIGYYAFYGSSSLTAITLPEGITILPLGVFGNCTSLRDVHLPQSLTVLEGSGDSGYAGVFQNCTALTELTLPDGLGEIGEYVFRGCSGLASITLPGSVTRIGKGAFTNCSALAAVNYGGSPSQRNANLASSAWVSSGNEPLFETTWQYGEADAFGDIHSFADLQAAVAAYDGSDLYVYYNGTEPFVMEESITLPEHLYFCADAESSTVRIPAGVTLAVLSETQNAFYVENLVVEGTMQAHRSAVVFSTLSGQIDWYRNLVASGECGAEGDNVRWELYSSGELVISGTGEMDCFYTEDVFTPWHRYHSDILTGVVEEGVSSLGDGCFCDCENLSSVTLPESLTTIAGNAFTGCKSLPGISLPGHVTSIGTWAFSSCSGLTGITIPASVTSMDRYAFSDCSSLTEILVEEDNTAYSSRDGVLYNKEQTELIRFPAAKTGAAVIPEGVTSIGKSAFGGCKGLTSVTIPESVTSIGNFAFSGCKALTAVYYSGTEEQKNTLIDDGWSTVDNSYLFNATWYYGSHKTMIHSFAELKALVAAYDGSETHVSYIGTAPFVMEESITLPENFYFSADAEGSCVIIPENVTLTVESTGFNPFYAESIQLEGVLVGDRNSIVGAISGTGYWKQTGLSGPYYFFYSEDGLHKLLADSFTERTLVRYGGDDSFTFTRDLTSPANVALIVEHGMRIPAGVQVTVMDSFFSKDAVIEGSLALMYSEENVESSNSSVSSLTVTGSLTVQSPLIVSYGELNGRDKITLEGEHAEIKWVREAVGMAEAETWLAAARADETEHFVYRVLVRPTEEDGGSLLLTQNMVIPANAEVMFDATPTVSAGVTLRNAGLMEIVIPPLTVYGSLVNEGRIECLVGYSGEAVLRLQNGGQYSGSGELAVATMNSATQEDLAQLLPGLDLARFEEITSELTVADMHWYLRNYRESSAGVVASGECGAEGDNLTWVLYDDGRLVISGTGAMMDYMSDSEVPWYSHLDDIKTVTIESGVTSIGTTAFFNCSRLLSITIPTSVNSIGGCAFLNCSSLTSVTIPEGVTGIWEFTFEGCSSLTSVTIPTSVTGIDRCAFAGCSSLTSVTIPAGVTSLDRYAFEGCSGLTSITIPASLRSIGDCVFTGCSGLQEVHFGGSRGERLARIDNGWDGRGNEDLLNAYWYYAGDNFGDIHSFAELKDAVAAYEASGDDIYVYYNGTEPFVIEESITLPKRVYFCADAEGSSVVVPAGVELIVSSGDRNAFYTENLIVEGSMTASHRAVVYRTLTGEVNWVISLLASGRCGSADSDLYYELYDDGRLIVTGSGTMEGYPWCDYNADIRTVTLPEGLRTISDRAFRYCGNLQSINLPASLAGIYDYAFDGCTGLREVNYAGSEREKNRLTDNGWSVIGNDPLYSASWTYGTETLSTDIHNFADLKALVEAYDGNEYYVYYNDAAPFVFEESISLPQNVFFCADADGSSVHVPAGVSLTVESRVPNAFYVENLNVEGSMTAYRSAVNYRNLSGEVTWLRNVIASGICGDQGDNLQWSLDDEGLLLICGTGAMADYESCRNVPWYAYNSSVRQVTLESGVTSIGQHAFEGSGMTGIDLPDTLVSIGFQAFRCCKLVDLVIPDGVTSIGDSAFMECSALKHVTIAGSVSSLGSSAFACCRALQRVALEDGVTSIDSNCFSECEKLVRIVLPESLTSLGSGVFSYCSNLQCIMIPESLTSIGDGAFTMCESLKDVYYAGTEDQRNALTNNGWNTSGNSPLFNATWHYEATRFPIASGECGAEGNNLFWTLYEDGELVISGSGAMADYIFPDYAPWKTYLQDGDVRVVVEPGVTSLGNFAFMSCKALTQIELPDSLTAIGVHAFHGCSALTEITIPDGVTSILLYAFADCKSLKTVVLPDSVTGIGQLAFHGCEALENIALPGGVTEIGREAFAYSGLKSIVLPEQLLTIGYCAFADCPAMKSIDVAAENENYSSLNGVLYSKDQTRLIAWPAGRSSIAIVPDSVNTIAEGAFRSCTKLTEVYLPLGVTTIEGWAFHDCAALTDVYFAGTEEQKTALMESGWSSEMNEPLYNAAWHYEAAEPMVVTAQKVSLNLDGTIGINYKVSMTDSVIENENVRAVFIYKNVEYPSSIQGMVPDERGFYTFTYYVPAAEFANPVSLKFVDGENVIPFEYKGERLSNDTLKYSPQKYASSLSTESASYALVQMLNSYCYHAYVGLGKAAPDIKPKEIVTEPTVSSVTAQDMYDYRNRGRGSVTGLKISKISLNLETTTEINLKMVLQDGYNIADYSFELDGAEVTPVLDGDRYVLTIRNIAAKELDRMYTLKITRGEEVLQVRTCALAYCYTILSENELAEEKLNICRSLYLYNQAANAYFEG